MTDAGHPARMVGRYPAVHFIHNRKSFDGVFELCSGFVCGHPLQLVCSEPRLAVAREYEPSSVRLNSFDQVLLANEPMESCSSNVCSKDPGLYNEGLAGSGGSWQLAASEGVSS